MEVEDCPAESSGGAEDSEKVKEILGQISVSSLFSNTNKSITNLVTFTQSKF